MTTLRLSPIHRNYTFDGAGRQALTLALDMPIWSNASNAMSQSDLQTVRNFDFARGID
jgi:hypothetical protein